jgi:adenylate kinase family enzyme
MIKSGAKEFLIDGFPRAMDQALRFEEMIKPCRCKEQQGQMASCAPRQTHVSPM